MASLHLVCLLLLCCSTAVFAEVITYICNEKFPLTSPQMSANIDVVLAQIDAKTARNNGFSTVTYGQGKDTVYGLGQCRKDVNSSVCSACIHDAAGSIRQSCYSSVNSTDERIFYDNCLLRYSDQKFFGTFDPSVYTSFPYGHDAAQVKNKTLFREKLGVLMNGIISQAIVPTNQGFGKGNIEVSSSETAYGVVQCTQDLSPSTCETCLKTGFANFDKLCRKEKTDGCRVQYGSCYLRYDTAPF